MNNKEIINELKNTKSFILDTVVFTDKYVQKYLDTIDLAVQRLSLLSEVIDEYLDICQDCAGDSSVGIPSCPFYRFPDIEPYDYTEGTLSSQVNPGGCLLQEVLQ